jgi:probable phosphoglycerate mutase
MQSTEAVPQPTLGAIGADQCELLLIRHGRSADVVPGSPESADPPLHADGEVQAARLAARLAGKTIHGVYSSHLKRAVQTAETLAAPRGLTISVHEELEEVRMGSWSQGEFRRRAAAGDPEWLAWRATGRWDGIPGGEGDDAFRARLAAVIDRLAAQHQGQTIAVVAHGGSINAYVAHLYGVHRSLIFTCENTSITAVRLGDHGPTIVTANDCHHLYDPVLGQA